MVKLFQLVEMNLKFVLFVVNKRTSQYQDTLIIGHVI